MSNQIYLLLDEPFSNVDQSLKVELQQNIKKILKEKKITTIIVTTTLTRLFIWLIIVEFF